MNSARTDLSVVIITLNEEENLRDSLPPLSRVAQDIVVVDSCSTDGTVELCASYGATVIQREWKGYSDAKNFGNRVARNRWILSVDADEVLSDELVESIKKLDLDEKHVYALDRITNYCGVWIRHSGWYPDWKIRIFDKKNVRWEGDFVHERLTIPTHLRTIRLAGKLYHYSYKTSEDHLRRMERYAELSAAELFAKRKHVSFLKRFFSPTFRFIRTYFLKLGILDGRAGLTISLRNARLVRMKYRKHKTLDVRSEKLEEAMDDAGGGER